MVKVEFVKRVQEKEPSLSVCAFCVCVCVLFQFICFLCSFDTETLSGLVPSAVVIVSRAQ